MYVFGSDACTVISDQDTHDTTLCLLCNKVTICYTLRLHSVPQSVFMYSLHRWINTIDALDNMNTVHHYYIWQVFIIDYAMYIGTMINLVCLLHNEYTKSSPLKTFIRNECQPQDPYVQSLQQYLCYNLHIWIYCCFIYAYTNKYNILQIQ